MDSSTVQSVIDEYISAESRPELRCVLDGIVERMPETVIFGGMLRDFALGRVEEFDSDIDLVANATRREVLDIIGRFSPTKNKFGGFRFSAGARLFDIWALEDTWAFQQGLVKATGFRALFETTFFGIDAALFHLGRRRYEFSEAHALEIKKRVLNINLRENPSPKSMSRRAVKMALKRKLAISPMLGIYISDNWCHSSADRVDRVFVKLLREHLDRHPEQSFDFSYYCCSL